MAENVQQPDPPDYPYGRFKDLPGTTGLPSFPDTFYGPSNKVYLDFLQRQATRLRGTNGFYYVKADAPERIDGDRPISNPDAVAADALARKRKAGMALYGEQVIVGLPLDSVRHEVQPDWAYLDPILVRGTVIDPERDVDADPRGKIATQRCTYELARVLCEQEWRIKPTEGDVVRLPTLLNDYFDVENVTTSESKFGGTGFFVIYKLQLSRTTKFEPQRKLPPRVLTTEAEIKSNTPP